MMSLSLCVELNMIFITFRVKQKLINQEKKGNQLVFLFHIIKMWSVLFILIIFFSGEKDKKQNRLLNHKKIYFNVAHLYLLKFWLKWLLSFSFESHFISRKEFLVIIWKDTREMDIIHKRVTKLTPRNGPGEKKIIIDIYERLMKRNLRIIIKLWKLLVSFVCFCSFCLDCSKRRHLFISRLWFFFIYIRWFVFIQFFGNLMQWLLFWIKKSKQWRRKHAVDILALDITGFYEKKTHISKVRKKRTSTVEIDKKQNLWLKYRVSF